MWWSCIHSIQKNIAQAVMMMMMMMMSRREYTSRAVFHVAT